MVRRSDTGNTDEDSIVVTFDPATDSVVERILDAVVEFTGRHSTELPPIFRVVDPGALESLFDAGPGGSPRMDGSVVFTYEGLAIAVDSDGWIRLRPR